MPAALCPKDAATYIGVSERRFMALKAKGCIMPLPEIGSYAVADLDEYVERMRDEAKKRRAVPSDKKSGREEDLRLWEDAGAGKSKPAKQAPRDALDLGEPAA